MINILVHGKSYEIEDIFFIEECPRCHCQFEFQKPDCQEVTSQFASKEFGYLIICPECGFDVVGTTMVLHRRVEKRLVHPQRKPVLEE